MSPTRIAAATCALFLLAAAPAAAQQEDCLAVLKQRGIAPPPDTSQSCFTLAVAIFTPMRQEELDELFKPEAIPVSAVFSQRDLQNRTTQRADLAGTAAQGHAVPGVQPAGVAAGTIAAFGTRSAQDALAALSVNPGVLFLSEQVSEQLAKLSRIADLTVFVPISSDDDEEETATGGDSFRYLGVRLRLNLLGASSGARVWNGATAAAAQLTRELEARIAGQARTAAAIEQLLLNAPNTGACAAALFAQPRVQQEVAARCGASFTYVADVAAAARLREQLAAVRHEADSKYLGADIRVDFGDPTLGAVENARGRFFFAGVAAGRRFIGTGASSTGIRARVGLRHAKLDSEEEAEFAAEGGLGAELTRRIGEEELNLSGAFEFRWGNAPSALDDQFQTNFTMLRGSFSVPIANGNSISINVGAPLSGTVSPIFSVNFNWGLLLPDRPTAP